MHFYMTSYLYRHRSALEYSGLTEVETLDDKRTPNPPPMKSSRDPEGIIPLYYHPCQHMILYFVDVGMKSINVKVGRASLGSAESDSYDTGEVRKAYHDVAHRLISSVMYRIRSCYALGISHDSVSSQTFFLVD